MKGETDLNAAFIQKRHVCQVCPSTVVTGPVQWCVALVVGEVCVSVGGGAVGLQQGTQGTHMAASGCQVEGGAAPNVSEKHIGPSLEESLHTLLLARHRLCERLQSGKHYK